MQGWRRWLLVSRLRGFFPLLLGRVFLNFGKRHRRFLTDVLIDGPDNGYLSLFFEPSLADGAVDFVDVFSCSVIASVTVLE